MLPQAGRISRSGHDSRQPLLSRADLENAAQCAQRLACLDPEQLQRPLRDTDGDSGPAAAAAVVPNGQVAKAAVHSSLLN